MKRAANQWGIGRVLYSLDTVWVDIEGNGKSFFIKNSEREKLDRAYLNTLQKLGLEPAKACGIQSLLMPKTVPEQKNTKNKTPMGVPGHEPRQPAAKPLEQPAQCPPVHNERRGLGEHGSKTVLFRNAAQTAPAIELYTVLSAKVQDGMSGSNTLVNLETPEKRQLYAYVRGTRPELTPGVQLSHVKLTTRKQDIVVFYVLESYEVYQFGQQAA